MTIDEIIGFAPEDKREAVKAELTGMVKITNREDAERLARENQFVRSVYDAGISKGVESFEKRFRDEKLPLIVEDEIGKRNPKADPRDIELQKMKTQLETIQRESRQKDQSIKAMKKAVELGIPEAIAADYIGETDEETDNKLQRLSGVLKPWVESAIQTVQKATFGNTGAPKAGTPGVDNLEARYKVAETAGDVQTMIALKRVMANQD